MHSDEPDIIILTDGTSTSDDIVARLSGRMDLHVADAEREFPPDDVLTLPLIVNIDLSDADKFMHWRPLLRDYPGDKIFVLPTFNRRNIIRLHNLGASDYFVRPLPDREFVNAAYRAVNSQVERRWQTLKPFQSQALRVSLKCLEDCFTNVNQGEPLPVDEIKESCNLVLAATAHENLEEWLNAIRRHHNYTFRHSMFVCGIITSFATTIGVKGDELETLIMGGLLHDIGKIHTPPELLDKPAELNGTEWQIMRAHPEHAQRIFESDGSFPQAVVDMAVLHHEKLDGSGYPHGLKGSQINDFVRIISIVDTYSALVDKRAYKSALPKNVAVERMMTMGDELDMSLVQVFKDIVLDGTSELLKSA